jgi:nitrogen regulatory protein P-II 1
MTVINAMGCGAQKGFQEEMTGIRTNINLLPKLKIEVIVKDEDVDAVVDRVCDSTITGKYGDGKIVIKSVEDVVRVRTKEHGEDAV